MPRCADAHEAEMIVERVVPRLSHANPGVVLGAVKVILTLLQFSGNTGAR